MKESLIIIGLIILTIFVIYQMVKAFIEGEKKRQYHKKNREAQYSGSAIKEKKGPLSNFLPSGTGCRADHLGERGERRVSSFLEELPCEDYWVFNDLLLKDRSYTTQIDHLIISPYGVFVIETKNIHGKVYGSEKNEFWKQYLPDWGYKRYGLTQEHQIRNPLWQNTGHIRSLRRLVFGNDIPIYGIVVFPHETDLYVTSEKPVLKMVEVVSYIKRYQDRVLSLEQMSFYRKQLFEVCSRAESDRKFHLENIAHNKERRDNAVANGKCPRCGGKLVLREGPYGKFYGCSSYPKCTYRVKQLI